MDSFTKEKLEVWLFLFIAIGTTFSLMASMAHLLESFGWANNGLMAWALAVVTVILNGVYVALWSICRQKAVRQVVLVGMILLFLVEFFGNFGAGGLLAMRNLPSETRDLFFGLDRLALVWATTFLFAAFLPILNFISIYALSEAGLRLVDQATKGQGQSESNQWAKKVLQMHEEGRNQHSGHDHNVNTAA